MGDSREIIEEKIYIKSSSLIEYVVYNRTTLLLQVKYKRGKHKNKVRFYEGITADEYNQIMQSKTKGRALVKVLKHKREENKWYNRLLRVLRHKK